MCCCASDYGYQHADGFSGPCIRDNTIILPDPCSQDNVVSYKQSQGYRKVAGDVCAGGEEKSFAPIDSLCITSGEFLYVLYHISSVYWCVQKGVRMWW